MTIGNAGKAPAKPTSTPKKQGSSKPSFAFKEWDVEAIERDLMTNIEILMNKGKKYQDLVEMSAQYRMDDKTFRQKIFDDAPEIADLLKIFNGLWLKDLMQSAMAKGNITPSVLKYLEEALQVFESFGPAQHITWVIQDKVEVKDYEGNVIDIEPDVDVKEEPVQLAWEKVQGDYEDPE